VIVTPDKAISKAYNIALTETSNRKIFPNSGPRSPPIQPLMRNTVGPLMWTRIAQAPDSGVTILSFRTFYPCKLINVKDRGRADQNEKRSCLSLADEKQRKFVYARHMFDMTWDGGSLGGGGGKIQSSDRVAPVQSSHRADAGREREKERERGREGAEAGRSFHASFWRRWQEKRREPYIWKANSKTR
jgi:hypothetical protein